MSKTAKKQALIGSEILFITVNTDPLPEIIDPNLVHNFVDITSLDGLGGDPVTPSSGDFNIFVETVPNGGFHALSDNGTISAALTGGSSIVDGTPIRASFAANPNRIKIVPVAVVGAVAYRVSVTQNLT